MCFAELAGKGDRAFQDAGHAVEVFGVEGFKHDLLATLLDMEPGTFVDTQALAYQRRDGDLALAGDRGYSPENLL